MTDEIGRSGSQRREETAPAGRAIPANNADGGGANVGHSGTKGDYCKNLFGPSETDGRHIHAWSCAWVEAIAGVSVSRTGSEHVGRPQQTNGRSRVPHVNSRDSGEQSALWLSSDLYAAGLGWVEGASQKCRCESIGTKGSHCAAESGRKPQRSLCHAAAAQPAMALSCDELCP